MLSAGDVFSWGEGDEGKLGHDNKNSCDRPRVIGKTSKKLIYIISSCEGGREYHCRGKNIKRKGEAISSSL